MTKQAINELKTYLESVDNDKTDSFRHSEVYDILKKELVRLGYWRAKQRGNVKRGFENSPKGKEHNRLAMVNMADTNRPINDAILQTIVPLSKLVSNDKTVNNDISYDYDAFS